MNEAPLAALTTSVAVLSAEENSSFPKSLHEQTDCRFAIHAPFRRATAVPEGDICAPDPVFGGFAREILRQIHLNIPRKGVQLRVHVGWLDAAEQCIQENGVRNRKRPKNGVVVIVFAAHRPCHLSSWRSAKGQAAACKLVGDPPLSTGLTI